MDETTPDLREQAARIGAVLHAWLQQETAELRIEHPWLAFEVRPRWEEQDAARRLELIVRFVPLDEWETREDGGFTHHAMTAESRLQYDMTLALMERLAHEVKEQYEYEEDDEEDAG
jgi:hypothetical protein